MPLESNFIGWLLFLLLYHGTPSGVLAEGVTVHEVMGDLVVANVPGEVTLEDAIRESVAEFVDDGIQAGLGGVALPTAVKMVTKSSPTLAIRLPWRRTSEMPFSVVTVVLLLLQFLFALMAAFMRDSILRMWLCGLFGMHLL